MRTALTVVIAAAALCACEGGRPAVVAGTPAEASGLRDVAVLVVETDAAGLRVTSASRVPAADRGRVPYANGQGRPTHRWRLLSPDGQVREEGLVAVALHRHLPPDPRVGQGPVHVVDPSPAFVVRAPWPRGGERLVVEALGGAGPVRAEFGPSGPLGGTP